MSKDVCSHCCKWASEHEDANPLAVRDDYPSMMRVVLRHKFGMTKGAANEFIESACEGNWAKIYETDVERSTDAEDYAEMICGDVFYCSDRWSWDRVLRIQWLYRRLVDRCRRIEE